MGKVPAIEARSVSFDYGRERVLDDISVSISSGEVLAIAGPNGSGKTTLLYTLCGIYPPASGRVFIKGNPIASISQGMSARDVALMPQYLPYTPWLTVEEIIEIGTYSNTLPRIPFSKPNLSKSRCEIQILVANSMEETKVSHLAGRLSGELSGGELRRVHLARVLAQGAEVLLLDEPTADLDLHHQGLLLDIIAAQANKGRSVVLVTHDLNFASQIGSDILLMDRGRVVKRGKPREIINREVLLKVYSGGFKLMSENKDAPLVLPASRSESGGK
jgi:iron complex transport system ATP-binding protein